MVNFKEISFLKVREGVQHFPGGGGGGGPTFYRGGGSNCLFPIETHIFCDFPGGGGVWTPCPPPSGSALGRGVRNPYPSSGSAHIVCGSIAK